MRGWTGARWCVYTLGQQLSWVSAMAAEVELLRISSALTRGSKQRPPPLEILHDSMPRVSALSSLESIRMIIRRGCIRFFKQQKREDETIYHFQSNEKSLLCQIVDASPVVYVEIHGLLVDRP